MLKYWHNHPPAHVILAAVHLKPSRNRRAPLAPENDPSADELIAAGIMKDNTTKNARG